MTKKLYDLAVKTGSFTDRNGDTKGRYENVGSILQMEDGGKMILRKRSLNPAGVPFKEGSDQIIVSMFEPKAKDEQPAGNTEHGKAKADGYQKGGGIADMSDDIPFYRPVARRRVRRRLGERRRRLWHQLRGEPDRAAVVRLLRDGQRRAGDRPDLHGDLGGAELSAPAVFQSSVMLRISHQ